MSNESFFNVGALLNNIDLLEGNKYKFYSKVINAIYSDDDGSWHKFGNIEFNDDERICIITIREKFNGFGKPSFPYKIYIPKWNIRMSKKEILKQMYEQGFKTNDFSKENH